VVRLDPDFIPVPMYDLATMPVGARMGIGETFHVVGFGLDEEGAYGVRRRGSLEISDMGFGVFEAVFTDVQVCGGDSGGPALRKLEGEDGGYEIIGVACGHLQQADDKVCGEFQGLTGLWTRVDTDTTRTFIQEATEAMVGAENRGFLLHAAGRTLGFRKQRNTRIEISDADGFTSLTVAVSSRKNLQLAVRHDLRPDLPGAGDHKSSHFCQAEGMGTELLCTFDKPETGVWHISVFSFDFENSYDLRIWVTRDEKKADGTFGGIRILDDEEEPVAAGCGTSPDRSGSIGWLFLIGACLLGLRSRSSA
jgi:hypothetical protein